MGLLLALATATDGLAELLLTLRKLLGRAEATLAEGCPGSEGHTVVAAHGKDVAFKVTVQGLRGGGVSVVTV